MRGVEEIVQSLLRPGERVLWWGQPRKGFLLRASDAVLIPFSVLWAGFAIFWEYFVIQTGGPLFMRLWGIPFLLVGIYIMIGRFFVDAYIRANTLYALTTERAIICSGLRFRALKSLNLRALADISLTEHADGTGTILFGAALPQQRWAGVNGWPGAGQAGPPSFERITDVRNVYELACKMQREA